MAFLAHSGLIFMNRRPLAFSCICLKTKAIFFWVEEFFREGFWLFFGDVVSSGLFSEVVWRGSEGFSSESVFKRFSRGKS